MMSVGLTALRESEVLGTLQSVLLRTVQSRTVAVEERWRRDISRSLVKGPGYSASLMRVITGRYYPGGKLDDGFATSGFFDEVEVDGYS